MLCSFAHISMENGQLIDPAIQDSVTKDILRRCKKTAAGQYDVLFIEKSCILKDFITSRVKSVNEDPSSKGSYKESARKRTDGQYFHFSCVRGGPGIPTDKSYRKVGCKAYLSFKVCSEYTVLRQVHIVLQRTYAEHTGHDVNDDLDQHVNPIHQALQKEIKEWIKLGVKNDLILLLANKWAIEHGADSIHDRRYYVTPEDIYILKKSVRLENQLDKNDAASVAKLVKENTDNIILYQEYIPNMQQFNLVLMTPRMRGDYEEYGGKMIYVDATGNTNEYGFPLYCLLVRNKYGRGVPAAYIISSSEDQPTFTKALTALRTAFPEVKPR